MWRESSWEWFVKGWVVAVAVLSLSVGQRGEAADAKKPKPPKKMLINGMSSGVLRVPEVAVWSCADLLS